MKYKIPKLITKCERVPLAYPNPAQDYENNYEAESRARKALLGALHSLPPIDRDIVQLRYVCELTLKAIGEMFLVGIERVRQIEVRAMRRLRHPSKRLKQVADDLNIRIK